MYLHFFWKVIWTNDLHCNRLIEIWESVYWIFSGYKSGRPIYWGWTSRIQQNGSRKARKEEDEDASRTWQISQGEGWKSTTGKAKKITVWLYSSVWKKRVGQPLFKIFFSYIFCGFGAQKIKWSQTQVFLKGQMVYYTTKVLVRNISWKIIHFCLFFGKFQALEFWENTILGRKFDFFDWFLKKLDQPYTLRSVGGVQPNNFFFFFLA